jgi:hypothetical protein
MNRDPLPGLRVAQVGKVALSPELPGLGADDDREAQGCQTVRAIMGRPSG